MGAATEGLQAAEWGGGVGQQRGGLTQQTSSGSRGVRAAEGEGRAVEEVSREQRSSSHIRGRGFPRQRGVNAPRSLFRGSLLPHQARPPQSPVPADPKGTARRGLTGPLASRAQRLQARRGELEGRGGPTAVALAPP